MEHLGARSKDFRMPSTCRGEAAYEPGGFPEGAGPGGGATGPRGCAVRAHVGKGLWRTVLLHCSTGGPQPLAEKNQAPEIAMAWRRRRRACPGNGHLYAEPAPLPCGWA